MTTTQILDFEFLRTVPNIHRVMDCVGAPLYAFEDGTSALFDDENPEVIYSPRMKVKLLEEFCKANLSRYQAFYDAHAAAIEDGQQVPMTPWWNEGTKQQRSKAA
jgi:hypothetical protein